jgi:heptaprenylglyceryl phosphate synthase
MFSSGRTSCKYKTGLVLHNYYVVEQVQLAKIKMAYFVTGNSCKAVDISSAIGIPVKRVTLDHLSTAVASEDKPVVCRTYEL